jgi:hypothetical protein
MKFLSFKIRDFVNLEKTAKIAFSLKDLVNLTSEQGVRKSKNCNISVKNVDLDSMLLTYNVRCKEKGSDPKGHVVKIQFDPSQIDDKSTINDLDVRVSCGCPAFLYWGAQWNLAQGDALEGEPRPLLQAPTDPARFQNVICKHLKVVSDRVNPFLKRLLDKYKEKSTEKTLERYEPTAPSVKQIEEPDDDEIVEINPEPKKVEKKVPEKKEEPKKEDKKIKEKVEKPKKEEKVVERTNPVKSY